MDADLEVKHPSQARNQKWLQPESGHTGSLDRTVEQYGLRLGWDGHGGSSVGSGARYIATILLWFGLHFLLRSPEHRLQALSAIPGPPSWSPAYSKPGVPAPMEIIGITLIQTRIKKQPEGKGTAVAWPRLSTYIHLPNSFSSHYLPGLVPPLLIPPSCLQGHCVSKRTPFSLVSH
jgi:hypothetical protein